MNKEEEVKKKNSEILDYDSSDEKDIVDKHKQVKYNRFVSEWMASYGTDWKSKALPDAVKMEDLDVLKSGLNRFKSYLR